jgi:hypothetical protein
VIEPVQEMKKTIGQIAHALIEHANVISNPGVAKKELIDTASDRLRRLSSLLHSHLRLVPLYRITCWVFWLPCRGSVLSAADSLIKLHNSLHKAIDGIHKENAQDVQNVRAQLGIFTPN